MRLFKQSIASTCARSVLVLAASCSTGAIAHAQTTPTPTPAAADTAPDQPDIIVTGTLLRGADTGVVPVATISAEDLEKRGTVSTVELVKSLPIAGATFAGDANTLGASRVEGASSINLRGLGNERTLVLLNGQRLPKLTSGATTIVDLNMVPKDVIGRVEILKNGGATTYGSDAVAGVVNFITRRDLNGFEANADFVAISGSKGDYDASLQWGKRFTGGNILLYAGYDHRSTLTGNDRSFTNRPYLENPAAYSPNTANPGVFYVPSTIPGLISPVVDPGCAAAGNTLTPLPVGVVLGASQLCLQNNARFADLVSRQDRYQAYGEINLDLSAHTRFSLSGLYARTRVDVGTFRFFAIHFPTTASTGGAPAFPGFFYIPASNPGFQDILTKYGAAGLGITPAQFAAAQVNGAEFLTNLAPFGIGGEPGSPDGRRHDYRRFDQFRVTAKLEGEIGEGANAINWHLIGNYGQSRANSSGGDVLVSRVELALRGLGGPNCNPATGTPGVGGCQYLNLFSTGIATNIFTGAANPGFVGHANTAELTKWLAVEGNIVTLNKLSTAEARLDGSLGFLNLGGGGAKWALGVQYRQETAIVDPSDSLDINLNPCVDAGAPRSSCAANPSGPQLFYSSVTPSSFTAKTVAAFAELSLPLADVAEARLSARFENGPGGNTFNPNAALAIHPVEWLTLRGSIGTTFRAPVAAQVNPNVGGTVSIAVGAARIPFLFVGNPDLKPETTRNYSLGIGVNTSGFQASVDYFKYDLRNQIQTEDGPSLVNTLIGGGNCNNPAFAALQARFTFSAAGCGTIANVLGVRALFTNGPRVRASGLDFSTSYTARNVSGADIRFGIDGTYNINFDVDAFRQFGTTITPAYSAVGFYNFQRLPRTMPRWRALAYVNWSYGPHNLRVTYQFVGAVKDERAGSGTLADLLLQVPGYPAGTIATAGTVVKSWQPTDIAYRWEATSGLSISASINNLFDLEPPLARNDLSYDAFTSNPLGRTFRIGAKLKF